MLRAEGISVSIAGAAVLRATSFAVAPGERVALIGHNGAGKTTTLRALMGLLPLDAGRIVIDGSDARGSPAHHRARMGIGYAPEERRLFGPYTVEENLRLPAEVLGLPRAETARRLGVVYDFLPELKTLASRRAAGLSGGQGKMVALGRAMMVGTRAILLDEPYQGLAPALALRYSEALARLKDILPDVSVLVTESSPDLLRPLVDRTIVIERGEIVEAAGRACARPIPGRPTDDIHARS